MSELPPLPGPLLVVNAGSSSLKFSVFTEWAEHPFIHGVLEELHTHPRLLVRQRHGDVLLDERWPEAQAISHDDGLGRVLSCLPRWLDGRAVYAVGHRIVHGGPAHLAPAVLTDALLDELDALVPLAPLHQPHNLSPVRALRRLQPGLPQVACFDTAFHGSNLPEAQRFALPRELHDAGVRRYGFHGLSYEYIASRLPAVDERAAQGRTLVLHLGNGASICALQGGRSLASSMGFTALDGLMMGTRCGNIDPGVLLWLMDERGMDARQIERMLYQQSGLLGVSGLSSDMRALLAAEADAAEPARQQAAREALGLYVHRITRELGSLAAVLQGVDAIVFTAGVGENAATIRERVMQAAAWLGVRPDLVANAKAVGLPDGRVARVSQADSRVAVWVVPTNEELMIARHTARLVGG